MSVLPTIKSYKSSVTTFDSLPISNNTLGDVRKTRDTGSQYYWSITATSGNLQDWRLVSGSTNPELDPEAVSNIELEFSTALSNSENYKEFTYSGNNLTTLDVWESATKVHKLFTKVLTYSGNKVTTITLTRHVDGTTMIKALSYIGNKVSSITKTVT
jgi:hypothetical protein